FRWTQIIQSIKNTFDQSNIRVYTFDQYRIMPKEIMAEIIKLTGNKIHISDLQFDNFKKNIGKNENILNYCYTFNGLYSNLPNFKYKNMIGLTVRQICQPFFLTDYLLPRLKAHKGENIRSIVDNTSYKNEAEQLVRKYGLIP